MKRVDAVESVREVELDIRRHLAQSFPELPEDVAVSYHRLPVHAAHPIVIVEAEGTPRRRLLVKCKQTAFRRWQSLDVEHHFFTEVAPKISEYNPATRCPRAIAYYPERDMLVVEMVDGELLSRLLFGLRGGSSKDELVRLLRLSGEWLASMHRITASENVGHPFDWIVEEFASDAIREGFELYVEAKVAGQYQRLAEQFRHHYRDLVRPFCTIHGMYVPFHVLVDSGRIYVIDLASCRSGYAFQDVASFTGFCDALRPWRRAVAGVRLGAHQIDEVFLQGYLDGAPPWTDPDQILFRFARILALVRFGRQLRASSNWRRSLASRAARLALVRPFRHACQHQLQHLAEAAQILC